MWVWILTIACRFQAYGVVFLQKLVCTVAGYIMNSIELIRQMRENSPFPKGARLFTSDATSMYSNIDPQEGIKTLHRYLLKYDPEDKSNRRFICQLLMLILYNNVFQFGDTYWWIHQMNSLIKKHFNCYNPRYFRNFSCSIINIRNIIH